MITFQRQTLVSSFTITGLGLHGGQPVAVTVKPGDSGIAFWSGTDRVLALPENVTDTRRCTQLGPISTIEHLMSAFAGLRITDAEIEVTGGELPACGGCSVKYVEAILSVGREIIGEKSFEPPFARVFEKTEKHSIAIGRGAGIWRYEFRTGTRWPGTQEFELELTEENYVREVAPARTIAFEEELPMIRQLGLGEGLDETSALVLAENGYLNEAKFPDEPARHKLLDLIGDLYLSGVQVEFLSVIGDRSGHSSNVLAAKKLRDACVFQ